MSNINQVIQLSILLIDDDKDIQRTLRQFLEGRGHQVFSVDTGHEGLVLLERENIDIVITDLMMPNMDGFEVLRLAKACAPDVDVVMVTGFGDVDGVVRALREGAFDFFTKPIDLQGLTATLERTARFHALKLEKNRYRDQLHDLSTEARKRYGLDAMVGNSFVMREIRRQIRDVAETPNTTVLIRGETGTGKELVARAIHQESQRVQEPFVAVDCTTIPEALVEAELFGHTKGAFTDAQQARKGRIMQAHCGTLFLDEIGDMPLPMQARLLRVLEERQVRPVGSEKEIPVDIRLISATNRDLSQAVDGGSFRQDLLYRLNTVEIHLPALRERSEDIPILARHFLIQFAKELRKPISGYTESALKALQSHHFPGNIRELRNVVERAIIACRSDQIGVADLKLSDAVMSSAPIQNGVSHHASLEGEDLNLEAFEERAIREALRRTQGNQNQAADLLGISRFAIKRRMNRYGIS